MSAVPRFATVEDALRAIAGTDRYATAGVAGGCISGGRRVDLPDGTQFFLKQSNSLPAALFAAEAEGLAVLGAGPGPRVPKVAAVGDVVPFILMEWIEGRDSGRGARRDFGLRFGRALASLHERDEESRFGLASDNFIGATPQPNGWWATWSAFFAEQRLMYQIRLGRNDGYLTDSDVHDAESIVRRLDSLLPEPARPAPLHGDLWGGNYLVDDRGDPVLIDPAAYYGHPEADLAMTELFGGFPGDLLRGYAEISRVDAGYRARVPLYNLYHLLNHAHLFGGGYAQSALSVIRRFR